MKLKKNRKFLVATAIVLALIISASATFAWVTSKAYLANDFANEGYGNSDGLVVNEPQDTFEFEIGKMTDKEVSVMNTGTSNMLARVAFEEMLKLLDPTDTVQFSLGATAPAGTVPVPYDITKLPSSGWSEITASGSGVTFASAVPGLAALPAGVKVYKSNAGNVYQAVYPLPATPVTYQACKLSGTYNETTKVVTVTDFGFKWYKEGAARYNSWVARADSKFANPAWSAVPFANTKPAAKEDASTVSGFILGSSTVKEITFKYNTADFAATPTANKWYYNANDGYFYYVGVLAGGTGTPLLISGVNLDGGSNSEIWQKYEYTLGVCVEGLQATEAALTDTTASGAAAGWQLNATADADLIAALKTAIAAAQAQP